MGSVNFDSGISKVFNSRTIQNAKRKKSQPQDCKPYSIKQREELSGALNYLSARTLRCYENSFKLKLNKDKI